MKTKESTTPIAVGLLISLSAGLMDAYSFLCRGEVFANAQTGNIILLGINLFKGSFSEIARYILPILFFGIGIALAFLVSKINSLKEKHKLFLIILFEAAVLSTTAFIPQSRNLIANSLISFVCGIQLEMFQKIMETPVATTMCIGNFRLFIHNGLDYLYNKDKKAIARSLLYLLVILSFVFGAIIGSFLIDIFSELAIMGSSAVLILSAIIFLCIKQR